MVRGCQVLRGNLEAIQRQLRGRWWGLLSDLSGLPLVVGAEDVGALHHVDGQSGQVRTGVGPLAAGVVRVRPVLLAAAVLHDGGKHPEVRGTRVGHGRRGLRHHVELEAQFGVGGVVEAHRLGQLREERDVVGVHHDGLALLGRLCESVEVHG